MTTQVNRWTLYFDRSHTRHGSWVGILFLTPQGDSIPKAYKISFLCTNNIAEYEALITGLKMVIEWKIKELQVYGDSQLVIRQVNDEYQTNDDKLMPYKRMVDSFKHYFLVILFEQVLRVKSRAIDAMATIDSLLDILQNIPRFEFLVEQLFIPAFDIPEFELVCDVVSPNSSCYQETYTYIQHGIIPPHLTSNQKKSFIHQTTHFTILEDTLYHSIIDGTLV